MIQENASTLSKHAVRPVLSDDQHKICERLLLLGKVREMSSESTVSVTVLRRWSVPLLVGPAGSGKGFVCEEVARRSGNKPHRRWELGSWIIVANRSNGTTLEEIQQFINDNPTGCVIYLAGVDTLSQIDERNVGYHQARVAEIERFLDACSTRQPQIARPDDSVPQANVQVIIGGRFAGLWGEDLPGLAGAECWKNADAEPLTDVTAVATWIERHGQVPVGIFRRLAVQPLVLRPMIGEEVGRVAARLSANLPRSLDGIGTEELAVALRSRKGWQAVASLIEQALVTGYEDLPITGSSVPAARHLPSSHALIPPSQVASAQPTLSKKPAKKIRAARLADRLLLTSYRSKLLPKARRLGLTSVTHLEALAVVRGYTLPGDEAAGQHIFSADAWREELRDEELAVALLSPGLEYSERAICRGALMLLRLSKSVDVYLISREVRRDRSHRVVRHVALLGLQCQPQGAHWHRLLRILPQITEFYPALPAGAMPDAAILAVLTEAGS